MSDTIRYAAYPSAKVLDAAGNEIQHLLWGDWVSVRTGVAAPAGMVAVHTRGTDGFMREADLQLERLLDVVFVDVGQGDGCLVVTPDDKKLIVDAGVGRNMYRYLDWRFRFRGGVRTFDAAVITHPDMDHYRGFDALFGQAKLRFRRVYHNGIMEQNGRPFGDEQKVGSTKYITGVMATRADLEAFLADPSRYGRKLYPNLMKDALASLTPGGDIRMLAASGDPARPNYMEGFGAGKALRLQVLGPVPEPDAAGRPRLRWFRDRPDGGSFDEGKTKNGHSVLLKLEYRDLTLLLGGDLNSPAEAFLLERYAGQPWPPPDDDARRRMIDVARRHFGADIAKCCHHGSADFTDAFMAAVNPAATVVSSGDEESFAHPRCDTLGAIGRHGRGWRPLIFSTELARSTREDEGDARVEIGRLLERIERATDPAAAAALKVERDRMLDRLAERNVTTYGAINLRSDGRRVVMAYKLETQREGRAGSRRTLTKWDIYRLERTGGGPLAFVLRDPD